MAKKNSSKGSVQQVPIADQDERKKALEAAMAQIEKQFGKGSVMRMGDQEVVDIETIPTGALTLDIALGVGGLPRGRIIEIYGPESSGKTTVALHCVAEAQKMGGTCAFIDAEHALDAVYANKIGVDVDNLLLAQPDTGEQALEITETLVRSGGIDVIVIDSVAALVPRLRSKVRWVIHMLVFRQDSCHRLFVSSQVSSLSPVRYVSSSISFVRR